MITIKIHRTGENYQGFLIEGHAGYASEGEDIVCSAVSALTINAVNSIERFTEDHFAVRQDDGILELILDGTVSERTVLLLDSMILGLEAVRTQYGNEFIDLIYEEV